jgi:hypothetical protein
MALGGNILPGAGCNKMCQRAAHAYVRLLRHFAHFPDFVF